MELFQLVASLNQCIDCVKQGKIAFHGEKFIPVHLRMKSYFSSNSLERYLQIINLVVFLTFLQILELAEAR